MTRHRVLHYIVAGFLGFRGLGACFCLLGVFWGLGLFFVFTGLLFPVGWLGLRAVFVLGLRVCV